MSQSIVTPNAFEGSDIQRINSAIAHAAAIGARIVIPRQNIAGGVTSNIWLLDSAILLPGNITLELDNCHLKLSDRCRDNFIRSANCGIGIGQIAPLENIHIRGIGDVILQGADHPRATGDSAKTLGQHTYGTDAGVAGESQTGDWRNIGILIAFVTNFSIENLAIHDSHCWAISLERCANGRLRDLRFASSGFRMIDGARQTILNQDGVDLRQGCQNIVIENISGYTGDDLVAFTAIPHGSDGEAGKLNSTMISSIAIRPNGQDDIRNIILKNVRGHCAGGHHIVRLLNTSGIQMHDIVIEDVIDDSPENASCRAAIKIGDANPRWGGVTPLGDTGRVTIDNVVSRAQTAILIAGSLHDSAISNVIQHHPIGEAYLVAPGEQYVRNVVLKDVRRA